MSINNNPVEFNNQTRPLPIHTSLKDTTWDVSYDLFSVGFCKYFSLMYKSSHPENNTIPVIVGRRTPTIHKMVDLINEINDKLGDDSPIPELWGGVDEMVKYLSWCMYVMYSSEKYFNAFRTGVLTPKIHTPLKLIRNVAVNPAKNYFTRNLMYEGFSIQLTVSQVPEPEEQEVPEPETLQEVQELEEQDITVKTLPDGRFEVKLILEPEELRYFITGGK